MKLSLKLNVIWISLLATGLIAQEMPQEDPSVRIAGSQALDLIDAIKNHRLVSDDVRILDPEDGGNYTTQFILVMGWDSIENMPGARDLCEDLCTPNEEEPIHLVSLTRIENDTTSKTVFVDVSALAPGGDIIESLGFSGCIADQLEREALWLKPENSACISRLAGGTFTTQRRVATIK